MAATTNLALRPFRNERLPWLLAGLLLAGAFVVSLLHARFVGRLLSGDEANTVLAVRADEERIAELEGELAKEPPLKIDASELTRLRAYKDLVDRRVFPWRRLLAALEETLSDDVRLSRISPVAEKGGHGMVIELSGDARTKDAAFSLAESLDASAGFSDAVLRSLNENGGQTEFELEVTFDPDEARTRKAMNLGNPATTPAPLATAKPGSGRTP